jgi:undecaprenyl-diphosphatase
MNIINSIILGLVEGLTEFLPISSTAHLIITSKALQIPQTEFLKFFEVFIQSGAIFAVLILYYDQFIKGKNNFKNVMISFIPTAIIGLLLYKIIKQFFFTSDYLIIASLFIVGLVFILIEHFVKNKTLILDKSIEKISIKDALIIGLCQSLAVIPGVSRAGSVIVTMMLLKYKREEAALYSFLLAIPTIFAASGYDLLKTDFSIINQGNNLQLLAIGFVTSFVSALFVVKWFIKYLQKNSLQSFGIYRIILAVITLLFIK